MTHCFFGYDNKVLVATLTTSAEVAGLAASQLQNPHGSTATAWQTPSGTTAASLLLDMLSSVSVGALSIHNTNLTAAATVRWRVGPAESLVETTPDLVVLPRPGWTPPSGWTFSRSGANAWAFDAAGALVQYAANTPRWSYDGAGNALGILIEGARINRALWSRDLTNAAWTKTNCTAALTATGITGVASSASVLTATLANGTCSQAIVDATSRARTLTVYARRRTGTGGVDMSLDNGATWTSISGTLTTGWQRFTIVQTLASPTIAFRLQTSGDAIDVDVVQLEDGGQASTPIITTSATVTRNAESAVIVNASLIAAAGTLYAEMANVLATVELRCRDSASSNIVSLRPGLSAGATTDLFITQGGVNVFNGADITLPSGVVRMAASFGGTINSGSMNGGSLGTYAGAIAAMDRIEVVPASTSPGGTLSALRFWQSPLTTGQTLALTSAANAGDSTLDPAALTLDTGTGSAGVVAGYGQSITVPANSPAGRYARLDVSDPTNPESCIRIAQAFVGPIARPSFNFDFSSTFKRAADANRFVTRGGQKYVEPRWSQRAWRVALVTVADADVWALVQEAQRIAEDGRNILFVPFPESAVLNREAVFGSLEDPSEISWQQRITSWRSWSCSVVERN